MALKNDLNAQYKSDLINYNGATDGQNVLAATGMGVGRFIKAPLQEFNPGLATVATSGSYNDLSNKPTIPSMKRQETYSGTTNSSGIYTVTFGTSYSVAPNIQARVVGGNSNQVIIINSISTTGFTVTVVERQTSTLLGIVILQNTTVNVNGASIDVLITEK